MFSNFAFNCNLRHYIVAQVGDTGELWVEYSLSSTSSPVTKGVNFRDGTICDFMADLSSAVTFDFVSDPCKGRAVQVDPRLTLLGFNA